VQGPAGIVVLIAGWMLDPVICAGMTIGEPRVDLAALVESKRLLIGLATPAHSQSDVGIVREKAMKSLRLPVPAPSRQMKLLFDKNRLDGVAPAERNKIISVLVKSSCRRPACGSRSLKMTSAEVIPAVVLKRKAVMYVRQSTQSQVMTNLESKRRQYDLVDVARQRGFVDVEIIDDDLGRSASGTVARPGFDRLVAWLCAGKVGAVVCFDASRLARNGRDWHHLLELCGLVEARVIDLDGVHNPCRPNDRLLLGMKGSISEFELGVLRARMLDAARSKARRGELRLSVPFGYIWHRDARDDRQIDRQALWGIQYSSGVGRLVQLRVSGEDLALRLALRSVDAGRGSGRG
jgi:DNA invertase Pin-like site-specific DNA recombinase